MRIQVQHPERLGGGIRVQNVISGRRKDGRDELTHHGFVVDHHHYRRQSLRRHIPLNTTMPRKSLFGNAKYSAESRWYGFAQLE